MAIAKKEQKTSMGFGVFVSLQEPTKGMRADAASVPMIDVAGVKYSAIQIITVEEMLKGVRPKLPFYDPTATYKKAKPVKEKSLELFTAGDDEDEE
jgi:hypothetical protein